MLLGGASLYERGEAEEDLEEGADVHDKKGRCEGGRGGQGDLCELGGSHPSEGDAEDDEQAEQQLSLLILH